MMISIEPTAQQREVFGALLLVRYHLAELNRLAEDMPKHLVDECTALADACSDQDAADYATAAMQKMIELA